MKIPPPYNRVMPYMILPTAYKFVEFMKNVFGAIEHSIIPRSEGVIMHGELCIGDSVIMYADSSDDIAARPAGIFIYVENVNETYKTALKWGASSLREPMHQPYGYTCGFHDPFGNDWWPVEVEKE